MQDFEKLGSFYLGKRRDLATDSTTEDLILYDSRDLVTHAVCVGMTGSGKTGLCVTLIEEAAIDGIPSIVIDPKGDLTNLALQFPGLEPKDFLPWINEDDARRKGMTPDQFAEAQADLWQKGLARWEQDGARIERLVASADVAIYTPGSTAGIGVSILKSLSAPSEAEQEDTELLRERIATTASSILALIGVDADPVRSREHMLLSALIGKCWADGRDLDLAALIQQIQAPPITRIGVLELESFYPAKERFELAMRMNGLLAAPGFASWMEGEALDIQSVLYTKSGKPRVAIFSIAHLGDAERMFFVSLLFNQILGWVRRQPGTTSLRALVYMDEIAGYFPPVANPPSKAPMLTLMKQARAFGVGMVLATQNPVDLDYKGLANAGTWFIGRLQTERDKARVLDGLEGASAQAGGGFDRAGFDATLSRLGSRVFLMNDVHEDAPVVFETRWALSYLRGPLTRNQIRKLAEARVASARDPIGVAAPATPVAPTPATGSRSASPAARPVLPPEVPQYFVPYRGTRQPGVELLYRPALIGFAKVVFADAKLGVDQEQVVARMATLGSGPVPVDWDASTTIEIAEGDLEGEPPEGSGFAALPPDAGKPKSYDAWKKAFADAVFRASELTLWRQAALKVSSTPGESERDFKARVQQLAREQRDLAAEKLRQKYAPKVAGLQDRIRRAEQAVEVQESQARTSKWSTALSFGTAVLGSFLGRKSFGAGAVSKAATAFRGVGRSMKESGDVARATENVEALKQQLDQLNADFTAEVDALAGGASQNADAVESFTLRPKKAGIVVRAVVLAWLPHWQTNGGSPTPAWN